MPEEIEECAHCKKALPEDGDYLVIWGELITLKETRQIFYLLACSEECMSKSIRPPTPEMRKPPKKNHPIKGEHLMTFECSYCGVESTYASDRADIVMQGQGKYYGLIVVNNFCSEACMNTALSLRADYYEMCFSAYGKKNCIKEQLKKKGAT